MNLLYEYTLVVTSISTILIVLAQCMQKVQYKIKVLNLLYLQKALADYVRHKRWYFSDATDNLTIFQNSARKTSTEFQN